MGQACSVLDTGQDRDTALGLPIKTLEKYWMASTGGIQLLPTQQCPLCPRDTSYTDPCPQPGFLGPMGA